jgi:aryl-alcohol dehydrogenase-like predicted oxidoreductase
MSVDKLILGTAGLSGQPYGRNKRVVEFDDAVKLIRYARERGINIFDTAPAYGHAEEAIGAAFAGCRAVTIFTKNSGSQDQLLASTKNLHTVPYVLWHNWTTGNVPPWFCGVTTYSDAKKLPTDGVVQVDWNILNQSAKISRLPTRDVHARSVFLQGVLSGGELLPHHDLKPEAERAQAFADNLGISLKRLALSAALTHPAINAVVIGPTTIEELDECVKIAEECYKLELHPTIGVLDVLKRDLTDPRMWK